MKVLFIQLGRVGDMLLLTPAFRALKDKYPYAQIHVLASNHNSAVLKKNRVVNRVYVYEKTPFKLLHLLFSIRRQKYDYFISVKDHYSTETKIFAGYVKSQNRIGFNRPGENVFNIPIPSHEDNKELHFIERCFNALKPLDITIPDEIPLPEFESEAFSELTVKRFIRELEPKPIILVNLSANKPERMWKADKWKEVIKTIDFNEFNVVLNFLPIHEPLADELKTALPHIHAYRSVCLDDVFSLIARSELVISPDTLPVHIAGMYKKPLLALYGGNKDNYKKFRPLAKIKTVVFAGNDSDNIQDIDIKVVNNALKIMLDNVLEEIKKREEQ